MELALLSKLLQMCIYKHLTLAHRPRRLSYQGNREANAREACAESVESSRGTMLFLSCRETKYHQSLYIAPDLQGGLSFHDKPLSEAQCSSDHGEDRRKWPDKSK